MLNRSCVPNKHNNRSMLTKPNLQMDIYTTENTKTSAYDSDGYLVMDTYEPLANTDPNL